MGSHVVIKVKVIKVKKKMENSFLPQFSMIMLSFPEKG